MLSYHIGRLYFEGNGQHIARRRFKDVLGGLHLGGDGDELLEGQLEDVLFGSVLRVHVPHDSEQSCPHLKFLLDYVIYIKLMPIILGWRGNK